MHFENTIQIRDVSWVIEPKAADIIVLFEEWGTRFWHYSDVLAEDPFFSVSLGSHFYDKLR